MRRGARRAAAFAAALTVVAPAPADAGWFGPEVVGTGVVAVGGVDVARDGTGAVVFTATADGAPHVFVSRLRNGAFEAPERVDTGVPEAASDPVVAVAAAGRLVVAWRSADRILAAFAEGGALTAPTVLRAGQAGPPDVDQAIQGTAYVVFAAAGDVRAVRLRAAQWEAIPEALDVIPAQPAGDGSGRPRVALGADGNAVVTWAEGHPDGRRRVYGRRITELRVSALPQEVSLPDLLGAPGGDADTPDITIEDDVSFAWVVWRQDFGGVSRAIARRLVGSLFEAPAAVDGWRPGTGFRAPRVSTNGDGIGLAVSQSDAGDIGVSLLQLDAFGAPTALGEGAAPLAAAAEDRDVAVAWQAGGGLVGRHAARDEPLGPPTPLGPGAGATELGASEAGDFVAARAHEGSALVSVWDEPPSEPRPTSSREWKALATPELRWTPSRELWGPVTYRVVVDGRELARTPEPSLTPTARIPDGAHRWLVEAIDRRGQVTRSDARTVRVDTTGPRVRVRVGGRRRAGALLRIRVTAADAGAGLAGLRVTRGDGSPPTALASFTHRYPRGRFTLVARATDTLGNVGRARVRLRIR